jgi:phage shock protein A
MNPDQICQEALQAKLNMYQAKERFEAILTAYNSKVDILIEAVTSMKAKIDELNKKEKPKKE